MKKFKKLVPAFCMLLLSAVMLASGTFAWFSVNDRVSATGMQVEAKANTQFLVITNELTGNKFDVNAKTTTIGFKRDAASGVLQDRSDSVHTNSVFPVFKATAANIATIVVKDAEPVTLTSGKWYTANSTVSDEVNGTEEGKKAIHNVKEVTLAAGDYFMVYTAYVGLAKNSIAINDGKLKVTMINENDESAALEESIKYLVAVSPSTESATATTLVDGDKTNGNTFNGINLVAGTDTSDATFVTVTVYVYVDGFGANVKDSKVADLKGKLGLSIEIA